MGTRLATSCAVAVAVIASGCATGMTGTPTYITDISATVNGEVRSSKGGAVSYWVEYGLASPSEHRSAVRTQAIAGSVTHRVSIPIAGLRPSTVYRYRLCVSDSETVTQPGCGETTSFTTTPPGGRSGILFGAVGPGTLNTRGDVFVMDEDGTHWTNLSNSPTSSDSSASWAPDARKIAYVRLAYVDDHPVGTSEIYVMNADGTGKTPLTAGSTYDFAPVWSPDGNRLAFSGYEAGNYDLYVMNVDGTHRGNLTNSVPWIDEHSPAWSPDGKKIAYTSVNGPGSLGEIYVMNADGTNPKRLTNNNLYDADPAWSPDGTKIAFTRRTDDLLHDVFLMNPDGSEQVNLTEASLMQSSPSWSPDGKSIAFDNGNGTDPSNISSISNEGGPFRNLTNTPDGAGFPRWSPRP